MKTRKEVIDVQSERLLELAKPLQKFLDDNYHHNCAVVITLDNAKVVEVQESTPLPQE